MLTATIPPYARHREEIAANPLVGGLRLNTGMPVFGDIARKLAELKKLAGAKPFSVDLKGRQLRVTRNSVTSMAHVELNHEIHVEPGTPVYFRGEGEPRLIAAVEGNRIILERPTQFPVGDGQGVTIPSRSLRVFCSLSERDRQYVQAAAELGIHRYMLSFTESEDDIDALRALDPPAFIVAKIESEKGLDFARSDDFQRLRGRGSITLMAARDDLFLSLHRNPKAMLEAEKAIIGADEMAIAASRLFSSLEHSSRVALADYHEVECLLLLGYRNFLLSDGICEHPERFRAAAAAYADIVGG